MLLVQRTYKEIVNLGRAVEKRKKKQGPSLQIQMLKVTELDLQTGHSGSTWIISADESKNIQDTTLLY